MADLNTLEALAAALAAAPQDKEGAFRVRTWKIVIDELVNIKSRLEGTAGKIDNLSVPTVEEITQAVKQDIEKDNLSKNLLLSFETCMKSIL